MRTGCNVAFESCAQSHRQCVTVANLSKPEMVCWSGGGLAQGKWMVPRSHVLEASLDKACSLRALPWHRLQGKDLKFYIYFSMKTHSHKAHCYQSSAFSQAFSHQAMGN